MPRRDKEAVPFLNSAAEFMAGVMPVNRVTKDEENYDTLKAIYLVLAESVEALYKDFNAFKLPEGVPKTTALYNLMVQIDGKQQAYDILAPLAESAKQALDLVDNKYKEG